LFQYKMMPFGLDSISTVFQRELSRVLSNITVAKLFQDDILIFGKDKKEHDCIMRKVLQALMDNGLTVKEQKCKFGKQHVEYLGHKISENGIRPKISHVKAI
ncbi:hypothetical protein NDU88_006332, partial [Pleurodeles waltl]